MVRAFSVVVLASLVALSAQFATAQTAGIEPQFIITWKTPTYAPPFFAGKVLPTANSVIEVSLSVLDNGKLADLSQETIYWYANGEFVGGGPGVRTISFRAPETANTAVDLRAQLQNYKGGFFLKTITIPIVAPEAVIGASYPRRRVPGSPFRVYAYPFYFNVPSALNLGISWTVNGKPPTNTEVPDILNVSFGDDYPSGSPISVSLTLRNPASFFEAAAQSVSFIHNQ